VRAFARFTRVWCGGGAGWGACNVHGFYDALREASVAELFDRADVVRAPARHMHLRSRRRCGRGEPSPGADAGGVGPVPVQMWQYEPNPGADVAGVRADFGTGHSRP